MKPVFKRIMEPLDSLFMTLGNEILKTIPGLMNSGHEKEVVSRLKREVKEEICAVQVIESTLCELFIARNKRCRSL